MSTDIVKCTSCGNGFLGTSSVEAVVFVPSAEIEVGGGKWGKRWTSPSCEAMFGPPGDAGAAAGGRFTRWKQRALYDAIKDIATADSRRLLARLSVWDVIGHVRLDEALSTGAPVDPEPLRLLVARRTI